MMLLPPAVRIFLATQPTDMRRSFDTLSGMVRETLNKNPLSGHLFVFRNRRGDRLKILFWDRTGLVLWYKRLEEGVFHFPEEREGSVEIDSKDLAFILEGIELTGAQRSRRFLLRHASGNSEK